MRQVSSFQKTPQTDQVLLETSIVVATAQQISTYLGDEAVILDTSLGTFYSLEGVGARVWSAIQTPATIGVVHQELVSAYDVDPKCCKSDLLALFKTLSDAGLIEVR